MKIQSKCDENLISIFSHFFTLNKLTEREETNYDTHSFISHTSATSHLPVSVIYKLILLYKQYQLGLTDLYVCEKKAPSTLQSQAKALDSAFIFIFIFI